MLAAGMTVRQIAEQETVSEETVKSTFRRLIIKMGTQNRITLIVELIRRKLLSWDRDRDHLEVNYLLIGMKQDFSRENI